MCRPIRRLSPWLNLHRYPAAEDLKLDWSFPAWKHLHIFSIVHVIFEAVYIPLAILTTIFGFIWPMMVGAVVQVVQVVQVECS
jgi:hypothetical protein